MKKYISIILAGALALFLLSACGNKNESQEKSLQIVATIFPEYDWVREILGADADHTELTMLLNKGVDLHSYQPTAEDILKISTCDLFIYVGGESDAWVKDALQEATNKNMRVINLLEVLGSAAKEEELAEGMESEEEEAGEEEEGPEYDEHVWLSLKNTQVFVHEIAENLAEIDSQNADHYQNNAAAYNEKLASLDEDYKNTIADAPQKTLLFGDRFPFRYLVDDYELSYYAAFVGCSAETEASFETIAFLAGKTEELGLMCVLTIESSDQKIAQTIIENTQMKEQKILTLDSMQSATSEEAANGVTYLSVMDSNLSVLKEALQ